MQKARAYKRAFGAWEAHSMTQLRDTMIQLPWIQNMGIIITHWPDRSALL